MTETSTSAAPTGYRSRGRGRVRPVTELTEHQDRRSR
jgi:hypothetical protein